MVEQGGAIRAHGVVAVYAIGRANGTPPARTSHRRRRKRRTAMDRPHRSGCGRCARSTGRGRRPAPARQLRATVRPRARQFIGICERSAAKPECISADTERACARAAASPGHTARSAKRSATYSQMASESHTVSSPPCRAVPVPTGDDVRMRCRVSACASATRCSRNGMSSALSRNQGAATRTNSSCWRW